MLFIVGVVTVLIAVLSSRHRDQASAVVTMTAGTGGRTLAEPNRSAADDALDLLRMDDDGGWQMTRAPRHGDGDKLNGEQHLIMREDEALAVIETD
jgi:hypothetical protein